MQANQSEETMLSNGERAQPAVRQEPRPVRYGLPCANCRAYYPAELEICPVCHSPERVSPITKAAFPAAAF